MKRLRMCRGVMLASVLLAASLAQTNGAEAATTRSETPSFWCEWTEPFFEFELSPAGAVLYDTETPDPAGTRLTGIKVVKAGSGWNVTGSVNDDIITVKITKEEGSDGMSDRTTDYAGYLNNGRNQGACLRHGNGTTPHDVIDVAQDDVLNVRSSPSASASIVATINARGYAWVYPGKPKNGWLKVSAARFPPGDAGRVTTVDGWVNAKYVFK